ncbi:olfactory receptor 52K1-like [Conger conger]|uniref:olfactory receptor 52K1-like n=1 Tax=Conger conger TaxID=82655 RepID=UPI002A5A96FD|nr:olfactory receptor 52K1-like [Conger conger]
MMTKNTTNFVFTLSGFEDETKETKHVIFSVAFICYFLIVFINVTLILTILQDKSLHEPMYFFLCNLCINALYGTMGFYPKFLSDLHSGYNVISYEGCLLQAFVIYSTVVCDYSILAVMAYDRYVAICRPLEYHSIMTNQAVVKFLVLSWFPPLLCQGILIFLIYRLILCRSNIENLFCSNWAIVRLSCYSTTVNNVVGYIEVFVYAGHVIYIITSYVRLIRICLKSTENRSKFMPHLLALINVTLSILFDAMYSRYGSRNISSGQRYFLAIEFLAFPPLFNPIIYGIQLTKLRHALLGIHRKRNRVNLE